MALSLGTVALATVVSGARVSPFSSLPAGSRPLLPFRWTAQLSGLNRLAPATLAGLAIASLILAGGAFAFAMYLAWHGRLHLRTVVLVGVVLHILVVAMPLFTSRDVYSYAMVGRIAGVYHRNPYIAFPRDFRTDPFFPPVVPDWRATPTPYGPATVMLFAVAARMVRSPMGFIWTFKILSGVASVATMLLVARLARRVRPGRAAFAAGMIGLNPVVLFSTVSSGHVDPLIGIVVVVALGLLAWRGRSGTPFPVELGMTGLLTIAALMKSPLLVLVPLAVVWSAFRRPAGHRLAIVAAHLAVVAGFIVAFTAPFIQARDPLGMVTLSRYSSFLAPSAFVLRAFSSFGVVSAWLLRVFRVLFPLAFVVAYVSILRDVAHRAAHASPVLQGAGWGWTSLLLILCVPILFPWYVFWLLPLVWLLPKVASLAAVLVSLLLVLGEPIVAEVPAYAGILRNQISIGGATIAPALLIVLVLLLASLRSRLKAGLSLDQEPSRPEDARSIPPVLNPVGAD